MVLQALKPRKFLKHLKSSYQLPSHIWATNRAKELGCRKEVKMNDP